MPLTKSPNNQSATNSFQFITDYWLKKLEGVKELQLPKDPSKSLVKGYENNSLDFSIDKADLDKIIVGFTKPNLTPPIVLLAALKVLLYRYSSQNDFCIGTTIQDTGLDNPATENRGSPYLDFLPIRTKIDCSLNFVEFVQSLEVDLIEANSNNQISVDQIISLLGKKNEKDLSLLFPVIFDYQKNTEIGGLNQSSKINLENFNSILLFGFVENEEKIEGHITFDKEFFSYETVNRMVSHFVTLLESIHSHPSQNIDLLNLIPKEEEFQLLKSFNDTHSPLPKGKTILNLFESQVIKTPNAIAVEFEGKLLSYKELDIKSNQLAHYLTRNGLKIESPVPICIGRSLEMVIGIFGILKSGGSYVPIDPDFPKDRIDYIIEDTKAGFVVCSSETVHSFSNEINRVIMDQEMEAIYNLPVEKIPGPLSPENLAYIIYTSGSTGKPKGAMVDHQNLINFSISLTKIVEYNSFSRQLSVTTFIFDAFCLELFVPLINGGCVFLVKKEIAMDGFSLSKKLAEVHPTHMQATPSGWQLLLSSGWNNPEGIIMTTGGEALGEETKNLLAQTGKLWNLYGPTETTITSTFKKMEVGEKVAIGKPIDNTAVYILSSDGSLNPIGIPGELCIGGKGVGRGYLNRPELTSQKFLPNPFSNVPGGRMYRTGDLAKWLPDGNIEYLGRMDDQVKIRGYRIELGEIESVLLLHPTLKQAVVMARENGQGDKRLVGYVVCDGDFDKESVSAFLRSKLPEYMVPAFWLQLEKIPLSFSGKIDRKALPDVGNQDMVTANYTEPRSELEKKLATLWQRILGLDRVGVHDDFFSIGGHSLLAMRTVAAVRKELGADLSIRELFSAPTVAQLALIIHSRSGEFSSAVPHPVERPENIPLSYNQQSLWFIHLLEGSIQYHIPLILSIQGKLDIPALEEALKTIVNRHEVLRTVITEKDGNDYQTVLGKDLWKLDRMELPDPELLDNEITGLIRIPFDLTRDHMMRACIITLAPNEYCLVITLHHIASDGWSVNILRKELSQCYQAITNGKTIPLPPLPLQYIDYAIWQKNFLNSDSFQNKIDYWKNKLKNVAPLQLPTDFSRPAEISREGGTVRFSISKELISDLNRIGLQYNATLFMTLISAFKVLMYRYTGQEDICVGTPIAGRDYQEFENMMGFFVNSIPLRIGVDGKMRFDDLLKQVQSNTVDAFDNREIPFEQMVESLEIKRDLSRNPVFQVFFALQNVLEYHRSSEELSWSEDIQDKFTSRFDLSFDLTEANGKVEGVIEYSKALFRRETVERMAGHFAKLLESIRENPTNTIGKFELLSGFEKSYILKDLNDTDSPLPKGKTILDLFSSQVIKTPNAVAVEFEGKHLSYRDLDVQSNQLAHYLTRTGLQPENPVPICIDRSLEMVIGIFGILKSSAAYVPIDPALPKDRIDYMVEDTKANFVICSSKTEHIFDGEISRVIIDKEMESILRMPSEAILNSPLPYNLAYIIYTSGSTGRPKGVMIEHRNVVNFLTSMSKNVEFDASSGLLSVTTYSFDIFYLELFLPLINGGKVFLVSREIAMDGFSLSKKLAEVRPTHMQATPSAWQMLLNSGWKNPQNIKMLVGGEALGEELKNTLVGLGTLWNMYGPTETTIWSTFKKMEVGQKVAIGKPIDNTAVYILSSDGSLNPVGIPGELCIGGKGVGRGYLNRPELTSQKFLPDPFSNVPGDRMYRTGDLARWLPDGNIEYLGRMDDQVKIRGYRIELGEIESVLLLHPAVKQAVVMARENGQGDKRLVGYVVCDGNFDKESVSAFLRSKLPEYMVPAFWLQLEKIPLSFSGKIDRKALPDVGNQDMVTANYTEPRSELEKKLATLWQRILGLDRVGVHDDFFSIGGHSLLAMRTVAAVRKELGADLSIRELFSAPTVAQLALIIHSRSGEFSSAVPHPVERPENIPLSYNQQSLWFIHLLEGSIQYHIPLILSIQGKLDIPALEEALKTIVNRHEVLRTVITEKDGNDYQTVLGKDLWKLDRMELPDPELLDNEITGLIRIPFDLTRDHMMRACIITLAPNEYCLVITLHHIASDGWSVNILRKELSQCYQAITNGKTIPLPPLPLQYIDYAIWQKNFLNSDSFQNKIDYWKNKLKNVAPLQLPTDFSRPSMQSKRGNNFRFKIEGVLVSQLKELGKNHQSTLFMTLLAAFNTLLYRYSGQEDICVGTPIAGRESHEIEDLTGLFVNSLALRAIIGGNMVFSNVLKDIRSTTLEAFENQKVPFEMVVEALGQERDLSRNPLFQVLFVLQNVSQNEVYVEDAVVSEETYEHFTSKFDMTFELTETDTGIEGIAEYNTDLYKHETIAHFVGHYTHLLKSILENPNEEVGNLKMLSTTEEKELIESFNSNVQALPHQRTILDMFREQVEKSPEALAVEFEGKQLTYCELNKKSNQVANFLLKKNLQPESLVPICLDRSLEMIIGILGILKAGGAYVPVDPTYPDERIEYVFSDTLANFAITTSDLKNRIQSLGELIILDEDWPVIEKMSQELIPLDIRQNHLAYIIYTSGSTGKPKGVMIEHRSLSASTLARKSYYNDLGSVLLIPSFAFDSSVAVIFGALTTGGKLILCKSELIKDPYHIKELLQETEAILCVPSYYRFLLEEDLLASSKLKNVIVAGENLDGSLVKLHFEKSGKAALYNEYGPTECTVWASVADIQSPHEKVTIGKPIDYSKIYIINKDNQLNPVNVTGELCIAGETLSRGYLNQPELTSEKFVQNPFSLIQDAKMYRTGDLARWLPDGNIEYLGRIDDQVKIRGYRIELGEIESTINTLDGVKESAVILREDVPGQKQLVGYVVGEEPLNSLIDEDFVYEIRKGLQQKLPNYMVPSKIVLMEHLPLTANNKIDKKNLPQPVEIIDQNKRPLTNLEKKISKVWCSALKKEDIDIESDFFEMGGHSLLAVKVITALEKEIGSKLAINQLFKHPNIRELAKAIENSSQNHASWNSLVAIKPTGTKPPLYIVHGVGSTVSIYYSLAKYIEDDQPIYGFQPKGLDGIEVPNKSLEEMASYYISLMIDQNPHGPYNISGYSFGGYVAYEMAKQLLSMGKQVGKLILFDTSAYDSEEKLSLFEKIQLRSKIILNEINFVLHEPQGYLEKKTRSFKRKRDKVLVKLKLKPDSKFLDDSRSVLNRVAKNNADILMRYRLVPYNGSLHLFRAKTQGFYVKEPIYYGWVPFVEKVHVVHVSGHHDNIFHKTEILKEMAEKIQKVLDE
ncbi:amino acid adenylation domain-containing protein [Aquiflexum sp. TKW24L]|uniref:non-ribosomal peptide synthetase n=1 Tax=Aquiflexum sp. TKW24L TaxID=2942212 RepID=UPI0020C0C536|nr:non-ribosomal peptide synthetase [Aquiflexum sp. TKW24L]MCL6261365.1 amino acid adenylation domain-containing protein [Aquiflexum sp. TKW24L]